MLTRQGASGLLAVVAFSFLGWLSGNPTLAITSLTFILIFLIENLQLNLALNTAKKLKIERQIADPRLEVGRGTDVLLKLSNPTGRATGYIIINDEVPEAFVTTSGSPRSILKINGNGEATIRYSIRAVQIGDYEIGDLSITAADPLGFANFTIRLPARSRLQVYPRLRVMEVTPARGVIQTIHTPSSIGQKAIRKSGLGIDFRGIREYCAGDDFKHIAWKAVAKSPRHSLMTRESEADRSLNLVIALEAKESLLDGSVGHRKLDYVVEAIVAVAYAASLEGDRILFAFGNHCFPLAIPGQSRQRQLIRTLRSTYNILPTRTERLQNLVECLLREVRQPSLIVLVTDSENQDPAQFETLGQLLHPHTVQVIAVRTTPIFSRPNLKEWGNDFLTEVRMGYDVVIIHERKAFERLAESCWRIGVPLRICDPDEVLRVLSQIYISARKAGVIAA